MCRCYCVAGTRLNIGSQASLRPLLVWNLSRRATLRFSSAPSAECVTARSLRARRRRITLPFLGEAFQFITEFIKQASSGLLLESDCHALSYYSTLLSLFQFSYVCRSVSPCGALPSLCFHAEYNSEFKVYSLGVDEHAGMGYSFAFAEKNLQISLPCSRSARIFFGKCGTPPLFPACRCVNERTNFKQRLYALKNIVL